MNVKWWGIAGVAGIMLWVVRNPQMWGEGEIASALLWGARATVVVAFIKIIITSQRIGELIGYSLGAYGLHPDPNVQKK